MNSRTIISAVYELQSKGKPTTIANLARYLIADEAEVKAHLLELRKGRIFDDCRRGGERVWLPWRELHA